MDLLLLHILHMVVNALHFIAVSVCNHFIVFIAYFGCFVIYYVWYIECLYSGISQFCIKNLRQQSENEVQRHKIVSRGLDLLISGLSRDIWEEDKL